MVAGKYLQQILTPAPPRRAPTRTPAPHPVRAISSSRELSAVGEAWVEAHKVGGWAGGWVCGWWIADEMFD